MASYNTVTGEINGCAYGTITWWHEARHKQQFEEILPVLPRIVTYNNFILLFTIILFTGLWQLAVLPVALALLLELDAWAWAIWKKKNYSVLR